MTDSESDTSNSYNVFNFGNFQNDNTNVNTKRPNMNFSCRNPMTSSMYMSRNYERPRYAESAYDQRSMIYRRETSPMSIQSACDIQPRNFQQYAGMSSRQSLFNGRSGSPMSMRSIDSSASVSAVDIAFAFKNVKFNKNDLKLIRDSYQKLLKQRVRKRIEKRRNRRLLLKGRRRSDSGDQASDSSVSSDDCRSVKTYKENMSSSRSARMDLTDFRKTFKDGNKLKDRSYNFNQSSFKNKFSVGSSSIINTKNFNNTVISNQFNFMPTQKDRFKNGFLLPSQRFNRTVASSAILENVEKPHRSTGNNQLNNERNHNAENNHKKNNCQSVSEEDEIFSEMTVEKNTFNIDSQRKRNLGSEGESSLPISKKSRIKSPAKSAPYNKRAAPKFKNINPSNNNVELSNKAFEFAKPSLPVRKTKQSVQEKVIAKSSQPLTDYLEPIPKKIQENVQILQTSNLQEKSSDNLIELDQSERTQSSDVSSRPSFIKRKLYTQKLDVAEKANLNTGTTKSPQSNVYSLQKEKNKSRKLVNQSCLNREVEDDNNLLDLIHKIVPPDRMNLTNQTTINQNKNDVNNKNKKDNEAKWDVTSVMSICNEDDVSDTYTDEEILEADNTIKLTAKNKDINSKANPIDKVVHKNFNITHNNYTKNNAKSSVKTFWDTDFEIESDVECQTVLPRSHVTDILKTANMTIGTTKQDFKNPFSSRSEISKNSPDVSKHLNNSNKTVTTFKSMHKLNTNTLSVRSHRISKKKKCCNETCANDTKSKLENASDKMKVNSEEPAENNQIINAKKKNIQSINSTDMPKPELKKRKEKNSTVATSQSKKSPKEKKSIKDEQAFGPKNKNKKYVSKSKSEKSSNVNNKKSNTEAQSDKTAINKAEKHNESTQVKNDHKSEIQSDNAKQQSKKLKIPKSKPKSKSDCQNDSMQSKKNNPVSHPTNLSLNNTVLNTSFISGRPIRSCRTPNQNKSIELSGSALLNNTRSLRSSGINLSSSIENITISIKPKKKPTKKITNKAEE